MDLHAPFWTSGGRHLQRLRRGPVVSAIMLQKTAAVAAAATVVGGTELLLLGDEQLNDHSVSELESELRALRARHEDAERALLNSATVGTYLLQQNDELQRQLATAKVAGRHGRWGSPEDAGTCLMALDCAGMESVPLNSIASDRFSRKCRRNTRQSIRPPASPNGDEDVGCLSDGYIRRRNSLSPSDRTGNRSSMSGSHCDHADSANVFRKSQHLDPNDFDEEFAILLVQNKTLEEDCRSLEQRNRRLSAQEYEMERKHEVAEDHAKTHQEEAMRHKAEAKNIEATLRSLEREKREWQQQSGDNCRSSVIADSINPKEIDRTIETDDCNANDHYLREHMNDLSAAYHTAEEVLQDMQLELAESQAIIVQLQESSQQFEVKSQTCRLERDEATQDLVQTMEMLDVEKLKSSDIMRGDPTPMHSAAADNSDEALGSLLEELGTDEPTSFRRKLKNAMKHLHIYSPCGEYEDNEASDSDFECDKFDEFLVRSEELEEVAESLQRARTETRGQLSHVKARCHELENRLMGMNEQLEESAGFYMERRKSRAAHLRSEASEAAAQCCDLRAESAGQAAWTQELVEELSSLRNVCVASTMDEHFVYSKKVRRQTMDIQAAGAQVERRQNILTMEAQEVANSVDQEASETDRHLRHCRNTSEVLQQKLAEARESREVEAVLCNDKFPQAWLRCLAMEERSEAACHEVKKEGQCLVLARDELQQLAKVRDCLKQAEVCCNEEAEEAVRLSAMPARGHMAIQPHATSRLLCALSCVLQKHRPALVRMQLRARCDTVGEPEVEGEPERVHKELEEELMAELRTEMDIESRRCAEATVELQGVVRELKLEEKALREKTISAIRAENEASATRSRLEQGCAEMRTQVVALERDKQACPNGGAEPSLWNMLFDSVACVREPSNRPKLKVTSAEVEGDLDTA